MRGFSVSASLVPALQSTMSSSHPFPALTSPPESEAHLQPTHPRIRRNPILAPGQPVTASFAPKSNKKGQDHTLASAAFFSLNTARRYPHLTSCAALGGLGCLVRGENPAYPAPPYISNSTAAARYQHQAFLTSCKTTLPNLCAGYASPFLLGILAGNRKQRWSLLLVANTCGISLRRTLEPLSKEITLP